MIIRWVKLYKDVNTRREDLGVSWRILAKDNGLTGSAFTRISQGKPLSTVNFLKVLGILDIGLDLAVYYK